jgi:hypothetical protein
MKDKIRIKFSAQWKSPKDKKMIEKIRKIMEQGRLIEQRDLNPMKEVPKDYRKLYCYYFDNVVFKFHKNENSILAVKWFNNRSKRLNKNKKRKPLTFKYHADKRRMTRVISNKEIEYAIYNGIWIPDFKKDDNGYARFDSRYFLDDLCVIIAEKKEELQVQTVYRISPASDYSFINYLNKVKDELKDMSFYVLDQTKINKFLNSAESDRYRVAYLSSGDMKYVSSYMDKFLDEIKDAVLYSSKNIEGLNSKWHPSLLKPKTKYSIGFLFQSSKEDLTKKQRDFFRRVGLDISKNCLYGKFGNFPYNFALFDMSDYSGSEHTWARPRVSKYVEEVVNVD